MDCDGWWEDNSDAGNIYEYITNVLVHDTLNANSFAPGLKLCKDTFSKIAILQNIPSNLPQPHGKFHCLMKSVVR